MHAFNTLRPRQNGRHFQDDIFKCIFLIENVWISLKISLKFVPKVRLNNIIALVRIMVWRRPGAKPLFEPMMVSLLTHICVARPQWVNTLWPKYNGWRFTHDIFKCVFLKGNVYILIKIQLLYFWRSHFEKNIYQICKVGLRASLKFQVFCAKVHTD